MNAPAGRSEFVVEAGAEVSHRTFGAGIVERTNGVTARVKFASYGLRHVRPEFLSPPIRRVVHDPLPVITADTFAGRAVPQREFLDAAGLFPMRNVTLLAGDGGTGKSLLTMQLATSVVLGRPWLGIPIKRMGPVYYFSAEDDEAETHIRLDEIADADGFELADLGELGISIMAGLDAVLATEDTRSSMMTFTPLFDHLRTIVDDSRPSLVVLDNLADVFAGNENVKSLARQFIGRLRGIAIEFGCAIVVLSHPSVSGMNSGTGTSGNTAWSNSVRSRLYLKREITRDGDRIEEDNPNRRIVETMKSNYGPTGGRLTVEWQSGRFISCDAPANGVQEASGINTQAMRAERVFMDLLRWHLDRSKFVSPNKSVSFAPAIFARHPNSEGVRARQFENAMNMLLDQNRIEIFTHGSPARQRQHIGLPFGREELAE